MTVLDPEVEQAIVAHLVSAPGEVSQGPTTPSGWRASTVVGGGPGADPSTIVFQRTRVLPTCQLHQVGFTGHRGIPEELVIRTWKAPDGSRVVAPVGGGSPGPSRRSKPWVNFTALCNAHLFTAGGNVVGRGSDQAHTVRLTFADGLVMEDTVDGETEYRIALFFEPRGMVFPADVEIRDGQGRLLAGYREFDGPPFLH